MRFPAILALLFLLSTAVRAEFVTVWSLGSQNGNPHEFGSGVWQSNASPGSASLLDCDYYFAGSYPDPIGDRAAPEPTSFYKNSIAGVPSVSQPGNEMATNRIHFNLTAVQATSTARIRVVIHQIWGGWWVTATNSAGEGYGTHTLQTRLNGTLLNTTTVTSGSTLVIEADAGSFTPTTGPNVLQISRTGGTPEGWIQFDALSLEINSTALADADGDTLPRWWEEDHGFKDTDSTDAALDPDHDGLTNLHEFARHTFPHDSDTDNDGLSDGVETATGAFVSLTNTGTNPLLADTDGDTLTDGEELALSPRPNPLLLDSDSDGAADAWEVRTGCNPILNTSKPPSFAGTIGINFVSELNPQNNLTSVAVTGLVPQQYWNNTRPLTSWGSPSGGINDIATPNADVLTNSAGVLTPLSVSWQSPSHLWANGNSGGSTQKLFDGYLNVNSNSPVSAAFTNVPYSTYDVIVYVGSVYDGAYGFARLNGLSTSDRWFITSSAPPQKDFVEPLVSNPSKPWRGNAIRYRNVTGSAFSLELFRSLWHEVGIHGIQIVDATADQDGDGMPTAWEFRHQLRADFNDASLDADGDGLNNAGEYTLQTNPRLADTDGDGLTDQEESTLGTDPILADTDADGLTDGFERHRLPLPTNPNAEDTDDDGRLDADEIARGTDPNTPDAEHAFVPTVTTSPRVFDWTLENLQIVWDHSRGHTAEREWGSDDLVSFALVNQQAQPGQNALFFGLTVRNGSMTYLFYSTPNGAFSDPDNDANGIYLSDWNNPPADMRALLGFSGHGSADISDRLRLKVHGTSTSLATDWNLTFSITNQDTGTTVLTRTLSGCSLAANVHNSAVTWQDRLDPPNLGRFHLVLHDGVRIFFQSTPLEDTAAFAAFKDSDDDGMPDVWETTYSVSEANLDADNDGLTNLREYLAGTLPHNADTDGDHASDGLEVQSASNPTLATSLPALYQGLPLGISGEDFNGNGMPDAWELWAGSFALQALLDADGDGQTNGEEAAAGTDPFDATSCLWSSLNRQGNDLTLAWPLLNHKQHRVWQSPDLASWTPATGNPVAFGSEYRQSFTGVINPGNPRLFYAAHVGDKDTDGDGVADWTEANVTGSSTTVANSTQSAVTVDANNDGIPDGSLSGDYASLLQQFQGGSGQGGFPGAGDSHGVSRAQASRFLMQAAFGPTLEDIERTQQLGYTAWITEQMARPPTLHSTYIRGIYDDMLSHRTGGGYNRGGSDAEPFLFGNNMMTAFARATIQGDDQLRQRVAFALSQIMVTSRRDANLENRCLGMADYYDIFVRHAFGNYLNILNEVTMHPVMGRYLSHVGNQKARPEDNQYPDENFAREIMQLFTIGLWELNTDGSRQLDGEDNPIPTYSNTEITQLARVMTGFWFGGHYWGGGGWTENDYATPMSLYPDRHDFGEKSLLHGYVIPARAATRENAERDVRDAVRHLFEHPNTPVFVGKQLIQFLVTDNPSPAYIQRIGAVFANNGQGVRGDLAAVVRAILLDDEARDPRFTESSSYGRLKEPVIRAMALGRAFGMKQVPNLLWWDWSDFYNASRQEPTSSPSVFNYYRPEYRAPGLLTQNNLAGPVFQITDSYSSISFPNRLWQMLEDGFSQWETYRFPLDISREKTLSSSPERLVDYLNTLFCAGRMRATTRSFILNAINQIPPGETTARARVAAYLAMTCPEGAIMK